MRTVLCLNEERKQITKKKRDLKILNISESLSTYFSKIKENEDVLNIEKQLAKKFEGYKRKYKKYFTILYEDSSKKPYSFNLNQEIIEKEEQYDGIFVLSTSREDLDPYKIVESYKNLKEVEMLFDDLKHFVDIRPIRHWLEIRVRSHVLICMLGLLLKRIFEINYMKGKATMQPLEEISKSKLIKYEIKFSKKENKTKTFPKVTQTTPAQMEIFNLIGIKNPMSLEKFTW
ncbi:transposase [Candidatus Magnetomorum sp. HK-1]|nr:transposase [Candidatus Magnetomorum sp. HK-1]